MDCFNELSSQVAPTTPSAPTSAQNLTPTGTVKTFSTSFKPVSPLNGRTIGIPNNSIKPISWKPSTFSIQPNTPSSLLPSTQICKQTLDQSSPKSKKLPTLSIPIKTQSNEIRIQTVIQSPDSQIPEDRQINMFNLSPLDKQFFIEFQKQIERQVKQNQNQNNLFRNELISNNKDRQTEYLCSTKEVEETIVSFPKSIKKIRKTDNNALLTNLQSCELKQALVGTDDSGSQQESQLDSRKQQKTFQTIQEFLQTQQDQEGYISSKDSGERFEDNKDKPNRLQSLQSYMEESIEQKNRICNCKKTKCLKLYCDCFAVGEYCGKDCNCTECGNKISNKLARNKIIEALLEKNPFTFHIKESEPENISQLSQREQKKLSSKKGCNCKKSGCQKKYCQCYQDGIQCNEHCKCTGCENCEQNLKNIPKVMTTSDSPASSVDTVQIMVSDNINTVSPLQFIQQTQPLSFTQAIATQKTTSPSDIINKIQLNSQGDDTSTQNLLITQLLLSMLNSNSLVISDPLIQLATLSASYQPEQSSQNNDLFLNMKKDKENSIVL